MLGISKTRYYFRAFIVLALISAIAGVYFITSNLVQNQSQISFMAEEETVLKISNKEQFLSFIDNINLNETYSNTKVILENNIELDINVPYSCYGEFAGVFDGNGKKISGINLAFNQDLTSNQIAIGLFGTLSGVVKNLIVEETISVGKSQKVTLIGGIAGKIVAVPEGSTIILANENAISNCSITLNTTMTTDNSSSTKNIYIGGIAGRIDTNANRTIDDVMVSGVWQKGAKTQYHQVVANYSTAKYLDVNCVTAITDSENGIVEFYNNSYIRFVELTDVGTDASNWQYQDEKIILKIVANSTSSGGNNENPPAEPEQPAEPEIIEVEISIQNQEITYGEIVTNFDYSIITAGYTQENLGLEIGLENFDYNQILNVGTYNIKVLSGNSQYKIVSNEATLSIIQKEISVTLTKDSAEYTGQNHTIEFNTSGILAQDANEVIVRFSNTNICDCDIYTIKFSILGDINNNYILKNGDLAYRVYPKNVEAIWSESPLRFNNEIQCPSVTLEGLSPSDYEIQDIGKDAGDYTAKIVCKNANYTISNATFDYSILKYEFSVKWSVSKYVYNQQEQAPTFSELPDFADKEKFILKNKGINAGKYTAYIDYDTKNYFIKNSTFSYEIEKYGIDITWTKTTLKYNGEEQFPEYKFTAPSFAPNLKLIESTDAEDKKRCGNYTATLSINNENYQINNGETSYTIEKYGIDITWTKTTLKYNGEEQFPKYKFDAPTFAPNLTLIESTTAEDKKHCGNYTATLSIKNENYQINNGVTSYTIEKYGINITWTKTTLKYNGEEQFPEYSFDAPSFDTGLTLIESIISSNKLSKNVDSYDAQLSAENENYEINNAVQTFSIIPQEIALKWSNCVVTYNGKEQSPIISVDEKFKNEIVFDIPKFVEVDEYTITININNSNFTFTQTTNVFKITQKPIQIEWSNLNLTYNGTEQKPTVTAEILEIYVEGGQINAGENYTATAKVTNKNYTIINYTQSFNIKPYNIDIVWGENEFTYDGQEKCPSFSGLPNFANIQDFKLSGAKIDAGKNYFASVSYDLNNNFIISNATCEFIIKPRSVDVVWGETTLTYNGNEQIPSYTLQTDFSVEVEITQSEKFANENCTAEIQSKNDNFILVNNKTTFAIKPCSVEVKWEIGEYYFNAQEQRPDFKLLLPDFVQTLETEFIGAGTSAKSYSAMLKCSDKNFILVNSQVNYEIKPVVINVSWANTEIIFNEKSQVPGYNLILPSFLTDLEMLVSGQGTNAGNYTAMLQVSANDKNYTNVVLNNDTINYEILPFEIELTWANTNLTYNGGKQVPTWSIKTDLQQMQRPIIEILGGQKEVGTFEATAVSKNKNFSIKNNKCQFNIEPQEVNVSVDDLEITISNYSGSVLNNVLVKEIEKPQVLPQEYKYFMGFVITNENVANSSNLNTSLLSFNGEENQNMNLSTILSSGNENLEKYNISLKLPKNMILPENLDLLLLVNGEYKKLDYAVTNNVVTFSAESLGEIYFVYTQEQNNYLWLYLVGAGIIIIILAVIIYLLAKNFKRVYFKATEI